MMSDTKEELSGSIQIRPGTGKDLSGVHDLVCELATFEKAADQVTTTLQDYEKAHNEGRFQILVAEQHEHVIGMMLYYDTWSTWRGKMLYLEDFVVASQHRRAGVGHLMMDHLLQHAKQEGYALVKWQVLDWNVTGINFYKKIDGIEFEKDWWNVKLLLQ